MDCRSRRVAGTVAVLAALEREGGWTAGVDAGDAQAKLGSVVGIPCMHRNVRSSSIVIEPSLSRFVVVDGG